MDNSVYGGPGDAVGAGDLTQTRSTPAISEDGFAVESERRAADRPPLQAGAPHAGTDPFDDQVVLQFGNHTDDGHDGAARRAAGVDVLPERDVLDVEPVQFVQHIEEVLHRPG